MLRVLLFLQIITLTACDLNHQSESTGVVVEQGKNLILSDSHGDAGTAWGLPECSVYHLIKQIHRDATSIIQDMTVEKGYGTCTGCHGSNGTTEKRNCLLCHNKTDLVASPHLDGIQSHNFKSNALGGMSDDNCIVCHVSSNMDGKFEMDYDLTLFADNIYLYSPYNNEADFCTRCHNRDHQQSGFEILSNYDDPLIAIEDSYRYVDKHGEVDGTGTRTYAGLRNNYVYKTEVKCSDCHALHGTENNGLIIDTSLKGATALDNSLAELSASPYRITTNSVEYSQLCVLCHKMQTTLDDGAVNSGNGLSGVHQVGGDCKVCHSHGEAAQAGL